MPVRVTEDHTADLIANLKELARYKLLVGVPEEKTERTDGGRATNALLAYVHENGSPARNIPARHPMMPAIETAQKPVQILKVTAQRALEGKAGQVEQGFHAAGLEYQNAIRARIRSNLPPPLAASTIRNRRRRSKGSTYRRQAASATDVTALIDTAQLLNAYTYAVKKT